MILNELSLYGKELNQEKFEYIISDFLKICQMISMKKGDHDFYYTQNLFVDEFFPGYTIFNWLNNPKIPKREKDYFRKIINRKQILDRSQYPESEMIIDRQGTQGESAIGCLAAFETESFVVSFRTDVLWEQEYIKGTYISAYKEDEKVSVRNCGIPEHVMTLEEEERQNNFRMVSSGKELWEKRESLYPHLIFCDSVRSQLEEAGNSLHIKMIMKRLRILEDYFRSYTGKFNKEDVGYRCREESETVKKNEKLRKMREFEVPEGGKEFFSWHISFSGDFPGRIYFLPDTESGKGIIGYVGKHLPTAKYSTI